jgi:hypothetical protein
MWERMGEFLKLGGMGPLAEATRKVAICRPSEVLRRDSMNLFPLRGKVIAREDVGLHNVEVVEAVVGWLALSSDHEEQGEGRVRGDGERSNMRTEGRIRGALGMIRNGAVAGGWGSSGFISKLICWIKGAVKGCLGVLGDSSSSKSNMPLSLALG